MSQVKTIHKPAIEEFLCLITGWRIWAMLGWEDIRLRYRRSTIGPFWITISMAVRIYFMGFLYGHLFGQDLSQYFPFLAAGIITWSAISNLVNETTTILFESESYLRNVKMAYIHLIMRIVLKNLIILGHNILALIPIVIYYHNSIIGFNYYNILLFIPNLVILVLISVLIGSIIAVLSTRFRDMPLITDSIITVLFFCTPIMWNINQLPEKYQIFCLANPIYHIVELLRAPLMGKAVLLISYGILGIVTIISFVSYYYIMNRCKYRVIFWL